MVLWLFQRSLFFYWNGLLGSTIWAIQENLYFLFFVCFFKIKKLYIPCLVTHLIRNLSKNYRYVFVSPIHLFLYSIWIDGASNSIGLVNKVYSLEQNIFCHWGYWQEYAKDSKARCQKNSKKILDTTWNKYIAWSFTRRLYLYVYFPPKHSGMNVYRFHILVVVVACVCVFSLSSLSINHM